MRKSLTEVRLFFYVNQNQFSSSQVGKTRIKIQAHCPKLGKCGWEFIEPISIRESMNENKSKLFHSEMMRTEI